MDQYLGMPYFNIRIDQQPHYPYNTRPLHATKLSFSFEQQNNVSPQYFISYIYEQVYQPLIPPQSVLLERHVRHQRPYFSSQCHLVWCRQRQLHRVYSWRGMSGINVLTLLASVIQSGAGSSNSIECTLGKAYQAPTSLLFQSMPFSLMQTEATPQSLLLEGHVRH